MKRTIGLLGYISGAACALLFVAEFFYHTTNDYFYIGGKFRDISVIGWLAMFLLWGGALYGWRKGSSALLQFVSWMTFICVVLEMYRSGDENYKLYFMVAEVAILSAAIFRRHQQTVLYALAALLITLSGKFTLFSAIYVFSGWLLFGCLGAAALIWLAFKINASYQLNLKGLKKLTYVFIGGLCLFGGWRWEKYMVHGIRFYERPVTAAVDNPKVSIIVPAYNAEDTIERALDSLRHQTLKDIEIIAVDDGSTDNTPQILDKYAEFDKRIKVIHQKNAYVGAARNRGMEEAKGEYIGFTDADDWVSFNYYEVLYHTAKKHNSDIAVAAIMWQVHSLLSGQKTKYRAKIPFEKVEFINDILAYRKTVHGYTVDKIYKKTFLDKHNIRFTTLRTIGEDQYFTTQALLYVDKMAVAKDAAYYYFKGGESLTGGRKLSVNDKMVEIFVDIDKVISTADIPFEKKQQWLEGIKSTREIGFKTAFLMMGEEDQPIILQRMKQYFPNDNIINELARSIQDIKVSVIVPVYNGEKTVRRTLDSLLKQTLKEIEIIVVDDGSTDNTPQILREYAQQYPQIKVIRQDNAYVGAARNAGRKQAYGEYIAFIDADDTVTDDFYERLYETAQRNHADIVAAETVLFVWENKDNLQEPYKERAAFTRNDAVDDLADYRRNVDGYVWDKIYRQNFLNEHDIWCTLRRTPAEDNFLTTPALMFADKMYVAKGAVFYYHRGNPSETGVKHTKLNDAIVEMFADLKAVMLHSGMEKGKLDIWLDAVAVARQRIVSDYYQCLEEKDKAAAKEKILTAFPEDGIIFTPNFKPQGSQNKLYQQL